MTSIFCALSNYVEGGQLCLNYASNFYMHNSGIPKSVCPMLTAVLILIVLQSVYPMCMLNDAKQPNLAQKAIVGGG